MGKMKDFDHVIIFITAADEEEASLISRVLLEQRKAACINIVPGISSLFWWRNKIDSTKESLLLLKTRAILVKEVVQLVKEIHSNDVPEIITLPIVGGNHDYLEWIDEVVKEK